MKKIILIYSIILVCSFQSSIYAEKMQNSVGNNNQKNISSKVDSTIASINSKIEELKNNQLSNDIATAREHIEFANKIIDWSAMIFTALAILIVIAGGVGLKEFSNIRKNEAQMKDIISDMKIEFEEIKKTKFDIQNEFDEMKAKIESDNKNIHKIIYLLNEGTSSFHSGNLLNAIRVFKEIKKIKPRDYDASCYLAEAYSGLGEFKAAIDEANYASTLSENRGYAYQIIGECYRRMNDYDNAIIELNKAIEHDKRSPILNSLGYSYIMNNDLDNAKKSFDESNAIKRNASACVGIGKVLLLLQQNELAENYFREGILLAEEELIHGTLWIWPYYNLTFSYLVLNKKEICLNYLNSAINKNKDPGVISEVLGDFKLFDVAKIPKTLLNQCIEILTKELNSIRQGKPVY